MKKVLGLDLGTTSIGWALVSQAENEGEKSRIIRTGVRVNPLTTDEKDGFNAGKDITTNADRRLKGGKDKLFTRLAIGNQPLVFTEFQYQFASAFFAMHTFAPCGRHAPPL